MKKRSRERCRLTPYPHSLLPAFSTPFYSIFQQPFFAMIYYFSETFSHFENTVKKLSALKTRRTASVGIR
jgi:hypothetical protein